MISSVSKASYFVYLIKWKKYKIRSFIQQQVLDNYYHVKMKVKRLIGEEVDRLKEEKAST